MDLTDVAGRRGSFTMTGIAGKSLLAVCAVLIVFRSVAYADSLRLRLEDVGAGEGVVLTDTEGVGFINFVGSIGGFVLNITTGNSNPVIGAINNFGELDLSSINISGPGSGTLRITLEDDSYKLGP